MSLPRALARRAGVPPRDRLRARLRGYPEAAIERGVRISLRGGQLRLGRDARLTEGVRLGISGVLEIAERARIGERTVINATEQVTIGALTAVSWDCQILDSDLHDILDADGVSRPRSAPVHIGRHCLIGTGALILKGVTIGDDAVVAAGSVVTRDVPARTLVAGNPAAPIRDISGWR